MPQWPSPGRPQLPQQTVAERFHEAGYATAAIGKWHVECWPHDVGFDHYLIPANQHANTAQWYGEDGGPVLAAPGFAVDYEADRVAGYPDERQTDRQPFYLYYNISPPHTPLADAPERYLQMYGRDNVVLRDNVDPGQPLPNQTHQFLTYLWDYRYYRDHLPYASTLPHPDFDLVDLTALYMGLTSWVDDTVGRLVAALDKRGMTKNTVIVFTSDHGDNLGSHGLMGKANLLEESYRVPMIAAGPGIQSGRVSRQVALLADWALTLASFAQLDPPEHWHGQNLSPVLKGQRQTLDRNAAFIETENHGCAVRTPTQLLGIPWAPGTENLLEPQPNVFHDLSIDPYQLNNLHSAGVSEAQELEACLRAWDAATPWHEPGAIAPPG